MERHYEMRCGSYQLVHSILGASVYDKSESCNIHTLQPGATGLQLVIRIVLNTVWPGELVINFGVHESIPNCFHVLLLEVRLYRNMRLLSEGQGYLCIPQLHILSYLLIYYLAHQPISRFGLSRYQSLCDLFAGLARSQGGCYLVQSGSTNNESRTK